MITRKKGQNLTGMNTFRMNVSCDLYIEYDSVADLIDIDFETLPKPVLHIGGGSNLLFSGNFRGTVLHSAIKFIYELPEDDPLHTGPDEVLVSVGAGVKFDDFCAWAAENGLWGAENLSHIPGEAGAAAVQNIGAYGAEASDLIRQVYCYDTEDEEFVHFDRKDCEYGYRHSAFKDPEIKGRYIVTNVVMALSRNAGPKLDYGHIRAAVEQAVAERSAGTGREVPVTPALVREVITAVRQSKLPEVSETGSAGSFFKNPVVSEEVFLNVCRTVSESGMQGECPVPHYVMENRIKIPAAWLIEQCGWKGARCGNAAVYSRQPLVIINATGNAAPDEVISLKNRIQASVKEKFGIELTPEVEII